ncbi:MAG: MinD/ParA family protein [Deltaproteobacteria bacterium]|nr:MinD/ParA family protein [Deltaproteobacteria bacterium]
MDQASKLRGMANAMNNEKSAGPFILAVTSGKGGVGKTNVVANLSCALGKLNQRVLVLDADMGLGNIDILLGLAPKYNIQHVLSGEFRAADILVEGPSGVKILPASSGIQELSELTADQKIGLAAELESLLSEMDVFLIDTGAGISSNVMYFNAMAHEVLIVVTPEPTSITDAYALMKVSSLKYSGKRFKILVNAVKNRQEAYQVFERLSMVTQRFLNLSLDLYGYVQSDPNITKAIREQRAVLERFPQTQASKQFTQLASKIRDEAVSFKRRGLATGRVFWKGFLEDAERFH